jgi:ATP-dependent Clp protease protease subunit
MEHIIFEKLWENFNAMRPFKIRRIVIELFSFGGSLFDAMAMASLIKDQENDGKIVEIRARGLVASAGLIILVSGTKGYRYIHPISMVMFHELKSFTIAYDSPSDKEEVAKIERFIQEQVNHYIVDRSKISIKELRERIQRREFWMDANTAIQFGFADKLLGN